MEVFNDFGKHDPEESTDLDFSDVFGGPPRRFLMQDAQMKYSFDEKVGPEEDGGSLLWTPMKEKVACGEERVGRRRHQSDDFYDDIFRGNESYGLLKRTYHDQDNLFGLDPGSRILSLARDLSPRIEPFGVSVPAQSRFSNQAIGDQEEIKHYIQPSYHQSPLSQDSQYNAENLKKDTKSIDSNGNKFHFSIYKWAGRGVPMIRPLVSRNSFMSKDDRRFETMMKIECDKKDSRSKEGIKELDRYRAEEAVFDVLDSKFYHGGDENVAFEVNSRPKFHGDEVEQQGSFNWDSKASVENSDDPCEDNFLVQELSDDVEEVTESSEVSEDIKALDAKTRQWSSGKIGNIRSLLSTLQYVLWPGSGWKPIALVDLIEANSVKRAYQKALLHLHPDKLQQKGAASHHKYIAEKVFAILQEAWDHFNTLAPL